MTDHGDEVEPIRAHQCSSLAVFQSFESPNVYLRNIVKHCLLTASADCEPLLPMREGFFRGKTARDVADYYQRKDLAALLERLEKQCEANKAGTPAPPSAAAAGGARRQSMRGLVGVGLSFRAPAPAAAAAPSTARQEQQQQQPPSAVEETGASSLSPAAYARNRTALAVYAVRAGVDQEDASEVAETLVQSHMYSLARLGRATRADLAYAGLNQPTSDLLLAKQDELRWEEDEEETRPAVVAAPAPIQEEEEEDDEARAFHDRVRQLKLDEQREEEEEAILRAALSGSGGSSTVTENATYNNNNNAAPLLIKEEKDDDDALFDASPPRALAPPPPPAAVAVAPLPLPALAAHYKPLPAGKHFHYCVSSTWGKHQRVRAELDGLVRRMRAEHGLHVWVDWEQLEDDAELDCARGVELSCAVLCCLTPAYCDLVRRSGPSSSSLVGFQLAALRQLQSSRVIALQLETGGNTDTPLSFAASVDCTSSGKHDAAIAQLAQLAAAAVE